MTTADFTIDQVSWHLKVVGNPETREHIVWRFWCVVDFLQKNELTKERLASSIADIHDDFAIHSSDLTPKGLNLMKKAYEKWLVKVDEGMSPDDLAVFEKALTKSG
jgi:hypothetical protein